MLTITIDTGNAAFHDDDGNDAPGSEVARILRKLAGRIESDHLCDLPIYDANGNRCGALVVGAEGGAA